MNYLLKKDLPDLKAGAVAELGEDNQGNQILRIPSQTAGREDWFFFKDEINNFNDWFEEINP